MLDTLTITFLFVFISAFIAVVLRKIKKDKCLKDFNKNTITLEKRDSKRVKGKVHVISTGLEFIYPQSLKDESGFCINSFLLYKTEYQMIQLLIRYIDDMNDKEKVEREKELKKTFHPSRLRRYFRKMANFFKTIKDSLLEIFNLVSNQIGKNTAAGMLMASQDKYVDKIKNELFSTVDNSFEPLLEKYIGYRVILELNRGEKIDKYTGILKRYTGEFIELIDVDYVNHNKNEDTDDSSIDEKEDKKQENISDKVDMVVPRRYGVVRGLAEEWSYKCL